MPLDQNQAHADEALLQLGRRLHADGYRFTCVTPATQARVNGRPEAQHARNLRDVFGWSRPFAPSLISADEVALLTTAGVLVKQGDQLRSTVRWSSLDTLLLVHSAWPTDSHDAVFFGPDSYRFVRAIHHHLQHCPRPLRHAVDIGCGAGVGALSIARAAPRAQVIAVDINPLALRYTAVNAALAGVTNVALQTSDLLSSVSGNFDLIVANPPLHARRQRASIAMVAGAWARGCRCASSSRPANACCPVAPCCSTRASPLSTPGMHCSKRSACAWRALRSAGFTKSSTLTCSGSNCSSLATSRSNASPPWP